MANPPSRALFISSRAIFSLIAGFIQGYGAVLALYLCPLAYPLLDAFLFAGLLATFATSIGINQDPFYTLFFYVLNVVDGEVALKKTWWIALLAFILNIGGALLGGLGFFMLSSTSLPIGLVPQTVGLSSAAATFFIFFLLSLFFHHMLATTNHYTPDGFGGALITLLFLVPMNYILFFVNRTTLSTSSTIATLIAGNAAPMGWWYWILATPVAGAITIALYYFFLRTYVRKSRKMGSKRERTDTFETYNQEMRGIMK